MPEVNELEQVEPQSIPDGAEVTVPEPFLVTVNVTDDEVPETMKVPAPTEPVGLVTVTEPVVAPVGTTAVRLVLEAIAM